MLSPAYLFNCCLLVGEFYDNCYCLGRPEIELVELRNEIPHVDFMGMFWDFIVFILKDIKSVESSLYHI